MKKIKAKVLGPNYKTVNINGIEFKIDINRKGNYFGYTPIMVMCQIEDQKYEIYTTILDEELKPVIPLRREIASYEELENGETKYDFVLFDNDKCVFVNDDYCYLIKLNETEFELINDEYIPKNYILKFRALYNTATSIIIVYNETDAYLYNVDTEKKESKVYNYIKPTTEPGVYLAYHLVKNKYFYPLFVELKIEKGNVIHNGVILKGDIALYPSDEILNSKTKLIKYCDSYYNDLVENKGCLKCKIIQ